MFKLWSLGGLTFSELIRRTWKESWADEVYGQAARLAFYHFLAVFPTLMLLSLLLNRFPQSGLDLLVALKSSLESIFPANVWGVMTSALERMSYSTARYSFSFALLASAWAALNGTWAVMSGLNDAYEVSEERPWWKVTLVAGGLTIAMAFLGFTTLVVLGLGHQFFGNGTVWYIAHWFILVCLLLITFALYYRFGPNLSDVRWRWSTPGAVFAVLLWIGTTLVFRVYVQHVPGRYEQAYGSIATGATMLLWFYLTGAAILIGGEVNSEIENAVAQGGHPDARRPGERRPGGRAPRGKQ